MKELKASIQMLTVAVFAYHTVQYGVVISTTGAFLPEHHAMKAYWGSGGITPHIL
jgi:hypothetical protein